MARRAIQVSSPALGRLASKFKALSEPTRLKLLLALQGGERTVSELVRAIGTSQGNISRQLQVLCEVGLLRRRKAGLNVYYNIADRRIFQLWRQASSPDQGPAPVSR
jgi:ArsR family transcriptional regulator